MNTPSKQPLLGDVPTFETYGQILKYNINLLDRNQIWLECVRQWWILVLSIGLSIYFIICIRRLRATQNKRDLDQFILIIEVTKLLVFMVIEFLVLNIGGLLLCLSFMSYIRMNVSGNFLYQVLELAGKGQYSYR